MSTSLQDAQSGPAVVVVLAAPARSALCGESEVDARCSIDSPGWSFTMTNMASRGKLPARYNIAQAKARFSELVQKAMLGEEVVIARDHKPVLRLVPLEDAGQPRKPGSAKGQVWMADDFDETPEDFKEYL